SRGVRVVASTHVNRRETRAAEPRPVRDPLARRRRKGRLPRREALCSGVRHFLDPHQLTTRRNGQTASASSWGGCDPPFYPSNSGRSPTASPCAPSQSELDGGSDRALHEGVGKSRGKLVNGPPAGAMSGDEESRGELVEGADSRLDDRLEHRAAQVK